MEKIKHSDADYVPHAAQRALEHYGITVDLARVAGRICEGRARFYANSMNPDANFYLVNIQGKQIKALFHETANKVITIAPLEFRSETFKRKKAERKKEFFRRFDDDADEEQ
jgi:hypothetical protein